MCICVWRFVWNAELRVITTEVYSEKGKHRQHRNLCYIIEIQYSTKIKKIILFIDYATHNI